MTVILFHPDEQFLGWLEGETAPFPKHALTVWDLPYGGAEYTIAKFDQGEGKRINQKTVRSKDPENARAAVISWWKEKQRGEVPSEPDGPELPS